MWLKRQAEAIVVAGAAVPSIGAELTTNATGQAIPATANSYVNGIAKQTAAAAGDQIGADLISYNKNP